MKKLLRTVVITVLSVVLLFSLQGMSAVKHTAPDPLDIHNNEFYNTLTESIKTYNDILDGLNSEAYSISSKNSRNYNDYYGGAYIDEETGELVVLVTDLAPTVTSQISTYAEGNGNVKYQLCDVSYAQIEEAINTISNHISELYDRGVSITTVRDDILNGCVAVGVLDLDHEKEAIIRAVANYDFLVFEDSEEGTAEATYGPGAEIKTTISGIGTFSSSLGFAATMNGQKGFVMTGHAAWKNGLQVKTGNTVLGTVKKTTHANLPDESCPLIGADAAFVQVNAGVTVTNDVAGTKIRNASTFQLPVNTPIFMYGCRSSWTSGKICGLDGGLTYTREDGQRLLIGNCIYADYTSVNGDSGAPILLFGGIQGGTTSYSLVGIHVGSGTNYQFLSPYNSIVNELGVSYIAAE